MNQDIFLRDQQDTDREVARFKIRNFIGFSPEEFDLPIYRILPWEFLLEMFLTNQLTLVKPKLWDDPYENLLLKSNAYRRDGTPIDLKDLQEHAFGQCWTLFPETDAFWRIYSHDQNGVRIKTTVRRLFDIIFDNHSHANLTTSFIGRVEYQPQAEIERFYSDPVNIEPIIRDTSGQGMVMSLLLKRNEFEHEKEVRLIYSVDSYSADKANSTKSFNIVPNDLFDDIMLDPRIKPRQERIYRETIQRLGFRNPIVKSSLYQFTPINITLPF